MFFSLQSFKVINWKKFKVSKSVFISFSAYLVKINVIKILNVVICILDAVFCVSQMEDLEVAKCFFKVRNLLNIFNFHYQKVTNGKQFVFRFLVDRGVI